MKLLFAALHFGYFRNLEPVIEELARRGHELHLAAERIETAGGVGIVERLAAAHPNVTYGMIPGREVDDAAFVVSKIRLAIDYLRYLSPPYDQTPALRQRAQVKTPTAIVALSRSRLFGRPGARRLLAAALDALDRAMPPSPAIDASLEALQPDAVVITPLVGVTASSQLDLLRSAAARRLPTAVCVWSWDHLSSKAIIRDLPGRLFVWNETQKDEAVRMHRVPPGKVVVTGAQNFDRWFDRRPSRTRADFCRHVGLADERPFVLWVCSALFPGSPSEAALVVQWAERLRASSDPILRNVNILIRPHPSRLPDWQTVDWRRVPRVAMWGGNPIDEATRNDYYDSLHHSAAVVGLNTSAFIEAGIARRPVLAPLLPEFRGNQEGTLHFRYLMEVGGGLLTTSRSLDEHERQLASILSGGAAAVVARQQDFVRRFVRPHGLDRAATPILADAIEALPREGAIPALRRAPLAAGLGIRLLMRLQRSERGRRLLLDERERKYQAGFDEKRRRTAEALARKAAQRAEKAARRASRASR